MEPNEEKQYWDEIFLKFKMESQQSLWRSHSDHVNITLLADWLGKRQFSDILKTDLFDEAVSQGLYPFLSRHSHTVHGIDIGTASVVEAKNRFPKLQASCADVRYLPFNDQSFDLVVSNSTLDHFRNKDEIDSALNELFRVLKKGSELLISLDNLQNPIVFLRSILPIGLLIRLHLVPYFVGKTHGRRGLASALEKAGFKVLETRAIMHSPRVLAVAIAGFLQTRTSIRTQHRFLSFLNRFEGLARLPTRYFTGYFVAIRALKPNE